MSEEYVIAKIKEALKVSEGDKHAAQKLIVTAAVRDQALLLGLAKPHLKAIIAANIEHILRAPKKKTEGDSVARFTKKEIEEMVAAKPFGEKRSGPKVAPPKSSESQASAIRQLVDAFKRKK